MSTLVFETTDVLGNRVALFEDQWKNHITTRHPEVSAFLEQIQETLESPECVYTSEIREESKVFYKRHAETGRYQNLFLKLAVAYDEEPARVLTAYFCPSITGGTLEWLKPKL